MIFDSGTCFLTFWKLIQPADSWLIKHINQNWGNNFFDTVLPYMRETLFWIPLYLFLLLFVAFNFKVKGWWWFLGIVVTAALADVFSSQIIKQTIMRTRPCQDPELSQQLRFFIKYCPRSSSFTSSHATSHFAQAMFFFLTLRPVIGKFAWIFFFWAFIIGYTQIYVGVHYPFDVFCGSLLGCGIGYFTGKMFNRQIGTLSLDK
ncbi:phosphatase PAP2 family protein [Pseudoflavitalea sp. G-6-1-2]|uniref:phosphatase PAP2 family protein n=1 Tax=Pseudoflavitalea sp. G-6-1-2 TaxID=2728841 RepID=UPI00146E90D4|nr:phosphatase PAP2 family protein [Pseudoflavitalea sp. G-6-1-2]NML23297.1 phosphatase PAP2 family protein [Pseudoflavitalea sp. G-6-1-2]